MRTGSTARDWLGKSTSMVRTNRGRLLVICAMLLLPAAGSAIAADPAIKPPIRGLISMGAYRFVGKGGDPINTLEPLNAKPGIFGGLVIIASWKQLQPTPTSEIGENNVIDQALADVGAYNARNPAKPLAVKLRVWGGFEAPDWAMEFGGAPILTVHNGRQRILGRFWSEAYRQAWSRLQVQLAAKYDAQPLIREVAITSCMSFTAEPFFLPTEPTVADPLRAAGYSDAAHRQCLEHAVADYAPWKASRLVLSLNPFYGLTLQFPGDAAFTEQVMRACRQAVGRRCVFDNHDLDANPPRSLLPIYAVMQENGPRARVPDVARDSRRFRRHHSEGRVSRCERDRALAGLPGFSAGAGRHPQAMGDDDRRLVVGNQTVGLHRQARGGPPCNALS